MTKYENAKTHRFKNNCKAGSKESNKGKDTTSHIIKAKEKDLPGRPSKGIKSNNQNSKGETSDKRKDLCHSICALLSVRR